LKNEPSLDGADKLRVTKRHGVIEITVKQIAVVMLMVIIILTGVFYIGVYFGERKVINAELEAQKQDKLRALAKIKTVDTVKNILSDRGQSNKSQLTGEVKSAVKQLSKNIHQSDKNEEQKKASNVSTKQILEKQADSQKQDKADLSEKKHYAVKIGTFSSEENAKRLADSLKPFGYEPEIRSDKGFFHVMIGNFDSMDNAKKFGDELVKKISDIKNYIIKTYE
jgi:cell division septation protein DedD